MANKNLGHATAYGYAKANGYTGTEAEFGQLMANLPPSVESAEEVVDKIISLAEGKNR